MAQRESEAKRGSAGLQFARGEQLVIVSAAVVGVAAFLPWITASVMGASVTVNGIDDDGVFTLAMGILAAVLVVVRPWDLLNRIAVAVLGLAITGFGVYYVADPAMGIEAGEFATDLARDVLSPGIGLYLTILGGAGLVVGTVLGEVRSR